METVHASRRVSRLFEVGKDAPRPFKERGAGICQRVVRQLTPTKAATSRPSHFPGDLRETGCFGGSDEDKEFLKPITHTSTV